MYTVRKLRNLAKLKQLFNQLSEKFMFSACLLLQKGLYINDCAIQSLKKADNVFQMNGFIEFLGTQDNQKIQQNFMEDNKIYQTFHNQMISKFQKEVTNPQYRKQFDQLTVVTNQNMP